MAYVSLHKKKHQILSFGHVPPNKCVWNNFFFFVCEKKRQRAGQKERKNVQFILNRSIIRSVTSVQHAHGAASNVVMYFMSLDGAAYLIALIYVHEPEGELVLKEVALSSSVTLQIRQFPEILQTATRTL